MMRNKRLYKIVALFFGVSLLAGISSCRTLTHRLHKSDGEAQRLGLSFVQENKSNRVLDSLYAVDIHQPVVYTDDNGKEVTFVATTKDEQTGEVLPTSTLKELKVYQTLKNIVERNGKVNLDFVVTVPKSLIDDRWQLRVYPRAFKENEVRIDLEPLVLSGADFLKRQEKGYAQYKAFLASIVPDSLYWREMIDQKGVARALSDLEQEYHNAWQRDLLRKNEWIDWRNRVNKRYMIFNNKMQRNRLSIDPEKSLLAMLPAYWLERTHTKQTVPTTFAEYAWGNKSILKQEVSAEDSLEIERKYTDLKRIAENERKKQEQEAMFNKLVKFPRIQARLDSIVQGNNDFKYYYSQELDADSGTKKIKLVLDGEVVAVDLSTYNVPSSDTLTYFVSAMVDLLDESPRYRTETIYRQVDKEVSAKIEFPIASAVVDPDFANNRVELEKIKEVIFDLEEGGALVLDSLTMTGYASPEGGAKYNQALANRRTEALRHYLIREDYFGGRKLPIRTSNGGENWRGVVAWLNDTTLHSLTPITVAQALNIIKDNTDEDQREQALRAALSEVYAHMKEELYPLLRETVFHFYTHRSEMKEEQVETTVIDEEYNKGRELLRKRSYKEALEVLSKYPTDYNYAICLMSLGYDARALDILLQQENREESANVQYLLAILYVRSGDVQNGLKALNRSAYMDRQKIFRAQLDPELNMLIERYNLFGDVLNF